MGSDWKESDANRDRARYISTEKSRLKSNKTSGEKKKKRGKKKRKVREGMKEKKLDREIITWKKMFRLLRRAGNVKHARLGVGQGIQTKAYLRVACCKASFLSFVSQFLFSYASQSLSMYNGYQL